jgi:PhzF family phenazine biosynthesis protein
MAHSPFSIVNVFSNLALGLRGNAAAVILLEDKINEKLMQKIAKDLNQPATSFIWPSENDSIYNIKWFAPDAEIQLCGHGALAAISFLFNNGFEKGQDQEITLQAGKHQIIGWQTAANEYAIKLEAIKSQKIKEIPEILEEAIGQKIIEYRSSDNKNIIVLENETAVAQMNPDFELLRNIDVFGYAVTAKSDNVDFVSRTLVPHVQQLEDQATGSSHALLVPYWSEKLNMKHLIAKQLSSRGGFFKTEYQNNYVTLTGQSYNTVEGTFLL